MKAKKTPYGVSSFDDLVTQNYFLIDKTHFIEKLEGLGEKYIFFLRPRRFGKSLFISMLSYYYGKNHQERFQELFGSFYIGQSPTEKVNSYFILEFNFSRIDTTSPEKTLEGFLRNIRLGVKKYIKTYLKISKEEEKAILSKNDAASILMSLLSICENHKMYILIDEYDHFANELLAFNFTHFKDIVSKNGYVRKFYETIKVGTQDGIVDRMFVTGVTPITLDSFTSGFNIASNLSVDERFNEMMGFTEEEVKALLEQTIDVKETSTTNLLSELKKWYNGYLFNEDAEKQVYNSGLLLYFINKYQNTGKYPKNMLDTNVANDYGKIRNLFKLQNPESNYQILEKLVQHKTLIGRLNLQFSFEKDFTESDFISLLFYMGYVTFNPETPYSSFKIPNFVIEGLYLTFFIKLLQEREGLTLSESKVEQAIVEMGFYGDPKPFFEIIQSILQQLSNRDFQNFDEKYIKLLIVATAMLVDAYFTVKSEREVQGGYLDILFAERPPFEVPHQYVFELKYLKKDQKDKLAITQQQAAKQLKKYIQTDKELQGIRTLKVYTLIVVKDEIHLEQI